MMFKTYCWLLKPNGLGLGLYSPLMVDRIRPGSLGYFDGNGTWHEIVHNIGDTSSPLQPFNFDLPHGIDRSGGSIIASENIRVIGKKLAPPVEYFHQWVLSLTFSATSVAIPPDIETEIHILHGPYGAALLICSDHTREFIKSNIGHLKEWGKANAKSILRMEKETKKFGFFVVTATRRTKYYRLKCWPGSTRTVDRNPSISASGIDFGGWVIPPADITPVCPVLYRCLRCKGSYSRIYHLHRRLPI